MTLLEAESDPQKRWQQLTGICRELSTLRRDDYRAGNVAIQREKWNREEAQDYPLKKRPVIPQVKPKTAQNPNENAKTQANPT